MTFFVAVDGSRWQAHQDSVVDAIVHASGNIPVPVIKGNGYGLGPGILARAAMRTGPATTAAGTVALTFRIDARSSTAPATTVPATTAPAPAELVSSGMARPVEGAVAVPPVGRNTVC